MKTMQKITLVAACSAILAGGAAAQDQEAGKNLRPRHEAIQERRPERQAHWAEIMRIYDENGDGRLDEIERGVLREDVRAGTVVPPRGARQGRMAMRLQLRTPPPEIVAKYDANGDGTLDETECAAVQADIASGKLERPRRGEGLRGPRGPRGPRAEVEPKANE